MNDIMLAKKVLNSNVTYFRYRRVEMFQIKSEKLYENIQKDNEKFESIDPDETVKQYILDTYPEMAISLGKLFTKR